nr:MAG TPA: hypothetical protein [Caudoviricetes sp.]
MHVSVVEVHAVEPHRKRSRSDRESDFSLLSGRVPKSLFKTSIGSTL